VKKGQNPGLYHGQIILRSAGEVIGSIPVELRVLPFVLPLPMTYRDLNKEYRDFMSGYISLPILRQLNGGDHELAKKQLDAIMIDMVKHGDKMPCHYERYIAPEWAEKCGMDNSMFIADAGGMRLDFPAVMQFDARRKVEAMDRKFGTHKNHYLDWGDEFDSKMLRAIRPMVDTYKNAGLRYANNSRGGYVYGLYIIDFYRIPITPDFANNVLADKVSFIGGDHYFGWYADQHVGPENPAFCRRQYGLGPYRAGLSCNRNYAHHLGGYNDNSGTFRSMNFFYGDGKGVIDTIAWEGYREGIDDIRYATLLQQLARPLTQSDNFRAKYAARIALQFLADMNTDSFDLSVARLEMIRHILKLQKFSK